MTDLVASLRWIRENIANFGGDPDKLKLNPTETEWEETLTKAYGKEKAVALIAAMKKAHPEKSIRTLS